MHEQRGNRHARLHGLGGVGFGLAEKAGDGVEHEPARLGQEDNFHPKVKETDRQAQAGATEREQGFCRLSFTCHRRRCVRP